MAGPMADKAQARSLFDADWYRATYPAIGDADPYEHFQRVGAGLAYDPNPLFSTRWYLARYPDAVVAGENALDDYATRGVHLGRDPGPLFCTRWYVERVPGLKDTGQNPLAHYLVHGYRELRDPTPVFDSVWYFARYPEADGKGLDAMLHFMHEGAALGYSPGPGFDTRWYLSVYPEVAQSGTNPLLHYLSEGAAKGFDPSPNFSTRHYLELHPELLVSGDNPLVDSLRRERSRSATSMGYNGSRYERPSQAAIADAQALVAEFSTIEPDLLALPDYLGDLRVADIRPAAAEQAWRTLYLSLFAIPKTIVLVDSIDEIAASGFSIDELDELLIVETDTATVSICDALPFGTNWRSFAELHVGLTEEDRLRVAIALINGLRPTTLILWGSRSGWEMLARYGKALRQNTRIIAVDRPVPGLNPEQMMREYWRNSAPDLASILSADPDALKASAGRFGISSRDRAKIRKSTRLSDIMESRALD
jgi:hypothetical protein